jgi:predicted enzyme related to lactoylglutathione lyase
MASRQGDIHWNELMTRDAEAATAFFKKVVGWTIESMPMPGGAGVYYVCRVGDEMKAGIFTMSGPQFDGMDTQWMTYIAVDDIDATAEAAKAAGGDVVQPPFDVPSVGRIAMIRDPSGGIVGMMTPAG